MRVGVFAIGHTARGDDAVGHALVERIRDLEGPGLSRAFCADGAALLDVGPEQFDCWVIVDAFIGGSPGTVVTTTDRALVRDSVRPASTHTLPVPDALEIARALGTLPPVVHVIGVIGSDFTLGAALSPAVERALPEAERALRELLAILVDKVPSPEPSHA
jgi:hydrogenase maturation protease